MNKKIFISTGEVSGDLHGSLLSKALLDEAKKKLIDLEICGLGGERMKKEGVKIYSRYYINKCNRNLGSITSYSSNDKNSKKVL